jgi:hypothetical protein
LLTRRINGKTPILADLAGVDGKPVGHHGGSGSNILRADGVTKYYLPCELNGMDCDIYLNKKGEQDAGLDADDVVIVPGHIGLHSVER